MPVDDLKKIVRISAALIRSYLLQYLPQLNANNVDGQKEVNLFNSYIPNKVKKVVKVCATVLILRFAS